MRIVPIANHISFRRAQTEMAQPQTTVPNLNVAPPGGSDTFICQLCRQELPLGLKSQESFNEVCRQCAGG